MRKVDFMKTAKLGAERRNTSRHHRRGIEAEALAQAKKELSGMSIPALKKLVRRKVQEHRK